MALPHHSLPHPHLLPLLLLVGAALALHTLNHQDSLEQIWTNTQYLESSIFIINEEVGKNEWLARYMAYFDVPMWLAEEKFQFCDDDGDLTISGREMQCF